MKKLSLKMKGIGEMLSREQMKNVLGGRAFEVDGVECPTPTANVCSSKCPCTDPKDWCVNETCKTRS